MFNSLPLETLANNYNYSRDHLAKALTAGTLALVIGAGVSAGIGLPSWVKLVRRCAWCTRVKCPHLKEIPSDELLLIMDRVERTFTVRAKFLDLVERSLYRRVSLTSDVIRQDLLIALGALTMGSSRGSVSDVVTFNFDNVLEWYLRLHGFRVNVVTSLPALRGGEDVRLIHFNGYLPHPSSGRKRADIVFSKQGFDRRTSEQVNPWLEVLREILRTKVCLFVGLSVKSFGDRILGPLLNGAARELHDTRITGFWLTADALTKDQKTDFIAANIVPVTLKGYSAIPEYILKVCQDAASRA